VIETEREEKTYEWFVKFEEQWFVCIILYISRKGER